MMSNINSPSSLSQNLGVPALLMGAMTLLSSFGQSQSVIYYENGENATDAHGNDVGCAGDINLDGIPDIVIGAGGYDPDLPDGTVGNLVSNAGRMYVYSGANGTMLMTIDGAAASDGVGTAVSGAGDLDGDGTPDIVSGNSFYTPPRALFCWSCVCVFRQGWHVAVDRGRRRVF